MSNRYANMGVLGRIVAYKAPLFDARGSHRSQNVRYIVRISLHLSDPATICKLFDILVLTILSYSCEVWAVNPKVGGKS